jgi:hypothetical protein
MRVRTLVIVLLLVANNIVAGGRMPTAAEQYVGCVKKVTDVMLNDVASPVAASRYYAYVNLAAYETTALYGNLKTLKGSLHGFEGLQVDQTMISDTDKELAILLTVMKMGERLLPSGYMVKKGTDSLLLIYSKRSTTPKTVALVDVVVQQIMKYVSADGFGKLNNMPRYIVRKGDDYWRPTQPAFMAPVEPHWNSLRTFFLDSAQQFKPAAPVAYDSSKASVFYKLVKEVYDVDKRANTEEREIANFWDCNPFAVQQIGHIEYGLKKISPGGHWVGIAGIACIQKKLNLERTVMVHALLSIGLADAFISCWDEKYRSNRVRPEHVIQKLMDPAWKPLLQTPPFPEYVSGHSVASNAAAVILAAIFGDQFSYADDTEVEFGLPIRKFTSFSSAAAEASISRLYGGIHYRDAIDQGVWQGKEIGKFYVKRMRPYFTSFAKGGK